MSLRFKEMQILIKPRDEYGKAALLLLRINKPCTGDCIRLHYIKR